MHRLIKASLLSPLFLIACGGDPPVCAVDDYDCDGVPDDVGARVNDSKGDWAQVDINNDGKADGPAVDTNGDGLVDALLLDIDGDGRGDSVDTNGDFQPDVITETMKGSTTGSEPGSGGAPGSGGGPGPASGGGPGPGSGGGPGPASGGAPPSSGGAPSGGAPSSDKCNLADTAVAPGTTTTDQYFETKVKRAGVNYMFIANGWGDGWRGHSIKTTTQGTGYEILSFDGSETGQGVPAGYPSMFCGDYSNKNSGECGLSSPKAISSLTSLQTGLRWSHANGDGKYNIAYDVWLSNAGGNFSGYFMVWFRDPAGAQPAGQKTKANVTVGSVPGTWDVWTGSVNNAPITNYTRPESSPTNELSFDMKEFFDHAASNGINVPGTHIMSVAIGSEIWEGPVTNLKIEDFCVDIQ